MAGLRMAYSPVNRSSTRPRRSAQTAAPFTFGYLVEQPAGQTVKAMWFGLRLALRVSGRRRLAALILVALGIAVIGISPPRSASHATAGASTACLRIKGNVAHYCGPATARLSVFPAAFFRHGSCARKRVDGVRLLQVRIGARSLDGSQTNSGLPYFSLGIAGSHLQPKSGNVIAYYRSRRWVGRVGSFKGDQDGGTLVAEGIAGSRGRATGRFRC